MLHRSTTIAGVSVVAAVGIGAAVVAGSHGTGHAAGGATGASTVIRTETAAVGGRTETILTDSQGMPLYYYAPDSAGKSRVSGRLAALWPPVTSTRTPSVHGLTGKLSVVADSHGSQVAYNGHLLYTFVSDRSGVVTGQDVENFSVATPGLSALGGSSSTSTSTNTSGGY